jgi:Ca2+-transporting ATPase
MSVAQAAERLASRPEDGLGHDEVERRHEQHGENRLPEKAPTSAWLLFFGQFKNALILVLFGAAALAAAIGNVKDAAAIVTVLVLNAIVGFYQEHRAEKSLSALRKMLPARARVRRGGVMVEIDARGIVPGDVVLLEPGDRVAADGRLSRSIGLMVDESSLTGESVPSAKDAQATAEGPQLIGDRRNMVHMNTIVTRGKGEMLVTAIGTRTAMGRLSVELAETSEPPSPLQVQLDQLGLRLGALALVLVALLFALELLRGSSLVQEILDAIALAVAAVPEGLPVVVTVTLALGMHRMAHQRAVVKRLASVETLGCTDIICSDKTGTLTLNEMTARSLYYRGERFEVTGQGYKLAGRLEGATPGVDFAPLVLALTECNDSRLDGEKVVGDPMEGALLVLAAKAGGAAATLAARTPRIEEIPFDASLRYMATFHPRGDRVLVLVKGAPDVLLPRCTRVLGPGGEERLPGAAPFEAEYSAMAARGLRGLFIARREIPAAQFDGAPGLERYVADLTAIALVGLLDPPRPEVPAAIAACAQAGIAVKMITGDFPETAVAIARELGIGGDVVSGVELDGLGEEEFARRVERCGVFARVAPEHKLRIVRSLQARGHVVAMTGDGVNDAPALKQADIGVAMGRGGTEVSREAASIVLTDDNFATLVSAVHQGRALYDNIVKFVRFQLSTTMGAILTTFFSPLIGLPEAFTPIQILWVAMIMDGPPAISLAVDAPRPGLMQDAPRKRTEPVLPLRRLLHVVAFGLVAMAGSLAAQRYTIDAGAPEKGLTVAFTTFVLFQVFNVFNARSESGTIFNRQLFSNRMLWTSIAAVVLLQVVAVHWAPAQAVFRTTALAGADWILCVAIASSILILEEGRKLAARALAYASKQRATML